MIRLYDYLPSQNGYKIRLLLALLGRDYEPRLVEIFQGESLTSAFLEKNPAGAVPVLEVEPGGFLAESNAILFYLARGTVFMPTDPLSLARVVQWFCFEQNQLEPSVGTLRFWTLTGKLRKRHEDTIEHLRQKGEGSLKALERGLAGRDFLVDNIYSVADIALFAYAHLAEDAGFELSVLPTVRAWIARIKGHPSHPVEMFAYDIDPHSSGEL
ncbi:MAG: glutathione S-transferase family protein [Alphaproteobacteria bacterium]